MASKIERIKSSLQIDEDIDLHITGWVVQRIGWFFMLAFLLCAALGVFGTGILSKQLNSQDGTSLKYERFTRNQSDTELEITADSKGGNIQVELPDQFTRSFKIEKITPEPREQKIVNGSTVYLFAADGDGDITLFLTGRQAGSLNTSIGINGIRHPFETYIYP